MKNVKFWANTRDDTENFFKALKAHGCEDNLTWTYYPEYSNEEIGWYSDDEMCVTYTKNKEYFYGEDSDKYKEFFFPIPGNEFVEVSPNCVSELDRQKPVDMGNILPDMVNNPSHYTSHPSGIECIEITRHMGFNLGNAMKYIWRCDLKKDAIEDLKKAVFYLNDEIKLREGGMRDEEQT